jgi:epoxyqueuosine reductase
LTGLSKSLSPADASRKVKSLASDLGFDLCGVTQPHAPLAGDRYDVAMSEGYGADMEWLKDHPEKRRDARLLHPGTKSVVMVGVSYADPSSGYIEEPPHESQGWIARYAQGKDYHVVVRKMLIRLAKAIEAEPGLGFDSHAHRVFVDTGPLLEKAYAHMAGIGWVGKNSLLINRKQGSWLFLGAILTPLELEFDAVGVDHCGTCTRCLDACPTDAFPAPYVLDARKCIATWTIESKTPLKDIVPEQLGKHVFGCDICQEVCPWNRKVEPSRHASLTPRPLNVRPSLDTLASMSETEFRARFPSSAVRRTDAERMGSVVDLIMRLERGEDPEP